MNRLKPCALGFFISALLLPVSGSAQSVASSMSLEGLLSLGSLSVIGSDGVFYRAAASYASIFGRLVAPDPLASSPESKLEAIDLVKGSIPKSVKFTGYATQLNIGKDDRLYLVVYARSSTSNFPNAPAQYKSTLYIIPTPFAGDVLGADLEGVATEAPVIDEFGKPASIKKVALEGIVSSLKVKAAKDTEYLYITTTQYQTFPFKVTSKLLIFGADGNLIKEANLN